MADTLFGDVNDFDSWLGDELPGPETDGGARELPVLPLRDAVLFPHMMVPLLVGRDRSMSAVLAALEGDAHLIAVAQRDEQIQEPDVVDLYTVGTEVIVRRKLHMPDGTTSIWVQGQRRVKVSAYTQTLPHIAALVTPMEETSEADLATEALMRAVLALFEKVAELSHVVPEDAYVAAMNADEPGLLADLIVSVLDLGIDQRQELLEIGDTTLRLQRLSILLAQELDVLELENHIQAQVQQEVDRSQREYFLREQMRVIQNELGESDPFMQEVSELRQRTQEVELPDEIA